MDKTTRDILLLKKIAKHCREIAETHTEFGDRRELFRSDKPYFKSVSMDLLQIGKLAKHLSKDFRQKHKDIPFTQIIGLRNIVAHGYGKLTAETVWNISHDDTPLLHARCIEIAKEKDRDSNPENNPENPSNLT